RTVFSAAHVVADPYADISPDDPAAVDWESTLAFRRHLWSHGLGVAEAMDTAQRGMGLDWAGAAELIR
ncbi:dihydrodipicolinate synthase family protein, partial [Streptomyces sp. SID8455]|nr:dihydrodipicolinate synthase family protein [Streptomyces sp. SID8455]